MTSSFARAAIVVTCAVTLAGCATDTGSDADAGDATTVAQRSTDETAESPRSEARDVRSRAEQAFVDELSRAGLPTQTAADTTIEVGVGICQGLAEGEQPDLILDRLRPLTSALAAQHSDKDTDAVGRALVDASRSHLCD